MNEKLTYGAIDWSQYQLLKWEFNPKSEESKLKFRAPTLGQEWFETYTKESNVGIFRPHPNFLRALNQLKQMVCRSMDWAFDDDIKTRLRVVGIEQKFDFDIVEEIYISFEYRSKNTHTRTTFKKGAVFSGRTGLASSLTDEELEWVADMIEQIRLYFSREKGASEGLFADVVDLTYN